MIKLLAIALLLAASPLGAQRTGVRLPEIPNGVPTAMGLVPVLRVPIDTIAVYCSAGKPAIGCFDPVARVIFVATRMSPATVWQTFEHEKCHLVLSDTGHPLGEAEEGVCDAIGLYRVSELLASLPRVTVP
jgi:hypothetical protein